MERQKRQSVASERPDGVLAGLSLEQKVPLVIGVLLLAVIVAVCAAAYIEVRRALVHSASERLETISIEFRDVFQQMGVQNRIAASRAAADPAVVAFAQSGDARSRAEALIALGKPGPQVLATDLRDSTGEILITNTADSFGPDSALRRKIGATATHGDSSFTGRFRVVRDTLAYPVAARVPGGTGVMLVQWRHLTGSRRDRENLAKLVGSDATLIVGNLTGPPWTDLEHILPAPVLADSSSDAKYRERVGADGALVLRNFGRVPGVPWGLAVDFPLSSTLDPAYGVARRLVVLALAALALGLIAGWVMSRRITRPLLQLTAAADAIASGDYSPKLDINRADELGRLARAFGTMSGEIEQAREDLERRVDERTKDLNQAMHQLEEAQETLLRREKLALLGQLASGVGHELRNPLGVMTNSVYYLKMVLGSSPPEVGEYLDILQQQITLSEKIVSDLLDFARSKPPMRRPTGVAEVVRTQIDRMGTAPGVHIDVVLPESLAPVLVDHVQMGQVVFNLLTNGVQAIDGSGTIAIRAQQENGAVAIDFTDSGPGVDAANLEKIFEPLFTTKARGIGLGLAVSRTLARANGGDLTMTSPPGTGATFRLTLPVAVEALV